jgi:FixJ family two-component response regulator
MKAGAVDFLSKPFSDDLLLQAVERAIAKGQSM